MTELAIFSQIQQDHAALIAGLLPDERRALDRPELGTYILREDRLPAARIYMPTSSRFGNALEAKIYNAYEEWRGFWEQRGAESRSMLSNINASKVFVQREYSPNWVEAHLALCFDIVCIPIDFHILEMALAQGELAFFVDMLDMCNRLTALSEASTDLPTLAFVPMWVGDKDEVIKGFRSRAEELAASAIARATREDQLNYGDATAALASSIERKQLDYTYLANILTTGTHKPLLDNRIVVSSNPGFYERLLGENLTLADAEFIAAHLAARFGLMQLREQMASLVAASTAYDEDLWPHFIHRNEYIARLWNIAAGRVDDGTLTRVFALQFPWLRSLTFGDVANLRKSAAFTRFRDAVREHERLLVNITSLGEFSECARRYEAAVTATLAAETHRLMEEVEKLQARRRNTAISFSATIAMGAASIVFPELIPLTILSTAISVGVGSASLRDLIQTHRAVSASDMTASRNALSLCLPPPAPTRE